MVGCSLEVGCNTLQKGCLEVYLCRSLLDFAGFQLVQVVDDRC